MQGSDGRGAPRSDEPDAALAAGQRPRPQGMSSDVTDLTDLDTVILPKPRASAGHEPLPEQRFVDHGPIARGGTSSIHHMFDNLLRRSVATKVLSPQADDDIARFIEEAQITGQLDHPNIVPIYDMGRDQQGVPRQLTMKLVQGRTLSQVVQAQAEDPVAPAFLEEMLQVFLKICDAVAFAHSRGVLHRDLKPDNIMIGTHGQVYLMDWGVAKLTEGQLSPKTAPPRLHIHRLTEDSHGSVIGTPAFMAPEQAAGLVDGLDERTDTYGLGGILYFLLTGKPPHDGGSAGQDLFRARAGEVLPPQRAAPRRALPPGLCRIAMRALSPTPRARYATAAQLKADVEDFLRGGGWLERVRFPKGHVIVEEGKPAGAAYIITEGQCELRKQAGEQQRFIRLIGAGEAFGEMAVLGGTTRTATVIAATDVSALVVTRDALDKELDRKVWLRSLVEAMAERFVELDRKATRLEEELARLRPSYPPDG